jgi:hypothetical protein
MVTFQQQIMNLTSNLTSNVKSDQIANSLPQYYCDQKILDTKCHYNAIVLSYILKRPLCINNLNFDCVSFENVNVRFTEKIFKKL